MTGDSVNPSEHLRHVRSEFRYFFFTEGMKSKG
jgi:hypothetical protein